MRVVGQGVGFCLLFFAHACGVVLHRAGRRGVAGVFAGCLALKGGLVADAPVVGIGAVAPPALEFGFALRHDHRVVEVPRAGFRRGVCCGILVGVVVGAVAHVACRLAILVLVVGGILGFFLLLLLQRLYDAVDGLVALRFGQFGKYLQAVLQFHGGERRFQFGQDVGAALGFLVFLVFFGNDGCGLRVASRGVDVVLHVPI